MRFLGKLTGLTAAAMLLVATNGAAAQETRDIKIALASTSFATAGPRIAAELGLFEAHGLAPNFVVMDSASSATTAMLSGSVDAAVSGPGEVIAAQARGQQVVAIANAYKGMSGSLVLAKSVADGLGVAPDAPVADRLKALEGLTIATPSATAAYTVVVRLAAKAAGAEGVDFVYMGQPAMLAALDSGAVDGFVGGAPFWAIPLTKGSGVLWISGPKGEFPADTTPANAGNIQVLQAFAEANPEVTEALAEVSADLVTAIAERPDAVAAAAAGLYPDIEPATMDVLLGAEALGWRVEPLSAADMAHDIAFLQASGIAIPGLDSLDPAAMIRTPAD